MNNKLLAIFLFIVMSVAPAASAQGAGGGCVAGVPLALPSNQDGYNQDFLRGVEYAIAEVNAVLGAAGALICFEIDGMDATTLTEGSGGDAQDALNEVGGGITLDSLTKGTGEVMRFLVTASYELNEGADWPSPWGHYWLYSNRGDSHTTGQPPFGEIEGDYDLPPYITRLAFLRSGNSDQVGKLEFAHHDHTGGSWEAARTKSLFIAGVDGSGELKLVELPASQIVQLDAVTVGWSAPAEHQETLWEFFADIVPSESDTVISIAFVLADAGTVALADAA